MHTLTLPASNQLYVIIGGQKAAQQLLNLAAQLALHGPLLLLDCGNRANPLPLVRELRRLTPNPVAALRGMLSARAFTCYQVVALLEATTAQPVPRPVLIFDLLASFYDESVPFGTGQRLLAQGMGCIQHLRRQAPLVISARAPLAKFAERRCFVEQLSAQADVLWVEEAPPARLPQQLSFLA